MRPTIWQAAALFYLVLPTALFLAFFSSYLLAAVGFGFVSWALWRFVQGGLQHSVSRPVALALAGVAGVLVAFSGVMPPLWQMTDYPKHYAILHLLMDNHWPVVVNNLGNGNEMLRYYLGWYMVPAGLCKLLGAGALNFVIWAWTALGLWLVFLLLAEALKPVNRWLAVPMALLFMFFSGADQLGQTLTGHLVPLPDHFEWWAIYYQYPSMMTGLVWAPQHGLSAWLAAGLLLNAATNPRLVAHAGLLFFAVFFWSPFCALGTVPFVLFAASQVGFKQLLSASNFLSVLALGPALFGYGFTSTGQLEHEWIFSMPGWTYQNLIAFWLLEFGIFTMVLVAIGTARARLLSVTVAVLLLVPLYKVGLFNDFAMRTPDPALATLAFIGIEVMLTKPWRVALPLVVVFLLGIGVPVSEITRGVRLANVPDHRVDRPELIMQFDMSNTFRVQYLAAYPNRFVR